MAANRQSARVADSLGGRPTYDRNKLQDLARERPETNTRGQHPNEFPPPVQRNLLAVDRGYSEDHPPVIGGDSWACPWPGWGASL